MRKALLGLAIGAASLLAAAGATADEIDMFASLVAKLGEPEHAQRIPPWEVASYEDRVPNSLRRFWAEHGRGSYMNGAFWICDPAPFRPVLRQIFDGDPEYDPARMTVVAYSAFGTIQIWDTLKKQISVHLMLSDVGNVPPEKRINPKTGEPFSDDSVIAGFIAGMRYYDETLFAPALERLGRLDDGEIYGFVPALQLGGRFAVENLHRLRLVEHAGFIAQLQRMKLTRLTAPEPPQNPYGRLEVVRLIGPPPQ